MTGHDAGSGSRAGHRWRIAYWGGAVWLLLATLWLLAAWLFGTRRASARGSKLA